jgi:hypothetical protein
MRLPRPRHWLSTVLVVFGLIVVVPGWFMALIVDRIAGSWPRRLLSRRVLLISSMAVLSAGMLVATFVTDIHPVFILGSIPIISLFARLAPGVLSSSDARQDDPLLQTYPRTTWRLCDPELSTGGVWRAEIESHPPGLDDFGNPNLVEPYGRSLIRDWSFRSGWPFLWCGVLRMSQARPGRTGPFSSVSEWWTVYRVTLDVDVHPRENGWLRFGDGFVEFQLEPHPTRPMARVIVGERTDAIFWERPAADKTEAGVDRELTPALAGLKHPLWDRWMDG